MISFQYDFLLWALLLLPLMAVLFYVLFKRKEGKYKRLGDPHLVKELLSNFNKPAVIRKFFLFTVAVGLLLLAVANLRSPAGGEKVTRSGVEVMIAMDVSRSMLAQDLKPNRLERAKQLLSRLVDKLDNDKVGIIIFAGKAYLQMPLSSDHAATKMYLSAASTESVPTQGTVIGDALKMSYSSFAGKEKKYKAIVLLSDGEDHDEDAIDIAKDIAQEGVVIFTVGIGSKEGAPIPDAATNNVKQDEQGNIVISKLNEENLISIAEAGNGGYAYYTNAESTASAIANGIATMDQRSITDESLINYKSYFRYLVGAAFLFLLLEMFISERKRSKA